ncbi:MAG: SGNH/GDSL hydrolase family protein [Huintestinicola sp.]
MKKITSALIAAAMIMTLFSACGKSENSGSSPDTEGTNPAETISSEEAPKDAHSAMVERSLVSVGNTKRLKAKMAQARSGEKTTIAYIGGSITEGLTAGAEACYAKLSYDFFASEYGTGDNVEYVNAGLSGTPSNLGVLRLERDVLSYEPDIVFIEFAVNDGQDKITKESYESLVKTVLSQDNEPAAVLLFNRTEEGYTAQEYMKQIGEFYSLPMISAADALTAEIDEGRMTWGDYSDDHSHPNASGHRLVCEFIENMYSAVESAPDDEEYTVRQGGIFGTPYENAVMVTPESAVNGLPDGIEITDTGSFEPTSGGAAGFDTSWHYNGGSEPMKLKIHGNAFFMIYKRNNSDSMGTADVYLDGEKLTVVNSNDPDGWGEAFSAQIIKFQSVKDLEIEIYPAEGSEGKSFDILGLAFTQNVTF